MDELPSGGVDLVNLLHSDCTIEGHFSDEIKTWLRKKPLNGAPGQ